MDLSEQYNMLWKQSRTRILDEKYELDSLIDNPYDTRRGLTVLVYLPQEIKQRVSMFIADIQQIEPEQYFYPLSDMHLTVLSIISCYEGFDYKIIPVGEYSSIIQKSLNGISPFIVHFQGVTASPSCVMLRGFLENDSLNMLRENLRIQFKSSSLQQSIDSRYQLQTAHSTIIRLRKPLRNPQQFVEKLEQYRNVDFGTFTCDTIFFVANDWYQRIENTVCLKELQVKNK